MDTSCTSPVKFSGFHTFIDLEMFTNLIYLQQFPKLKLPSAPSYLIALQRLCCDFWLEITWALKSFVSLRFREARRALSSKVVYILYRQQSQHPHPRPFLVTRYVHLDLRLHFDYILFSFTPLHHPRSNLFSIKVYFKRSQNRDIFHFKSP